MSSLLDGIDTRDVGAPKRGPAPREGLSNTAKLAIAGGAIVLAVGILFWQFQGSSTNQSVLSAAEQETSAKLAKEDAARKAPRQPGQPAPPPPFIPTVNETFNKR